MTERRTVAQVFTACAVCAGIGGWIGSCGGVIWTIVGILAGGLIAYLAFDPKAAGQAVKQAAKETWPKFAPHFSREVVKLWMKYTLAALPVLASGFPMGYLLASGEKHPIESAVSRVVFGLSMGTCFGVALMSFFCVAAPLSLALIRWKKPEECYPQGWSGTPRRFGRKVLCYGNLVAVAIWAPVIAFALIVGFGRLIYAICTNGRRIGRFLLRVFTLIHSNGRVIYALDVMLGIAIGLKLGGPRFEVVLISALAGGMLATTNYFLVAPWLRTCQARTLNRT